MRVFAARSMHYVCLPCSREASHPAGGRQFWRALRSQLATSTDGAGAGRVNAGCFRTRKRLRNWEWHRLVSFAIQICFERTFHPIERSRQVGRDPKAGDARRAARPAEGQRPRERAEEGKETAGQDKSVRFPPAIGRRSRDALELCTWSIDVLARFEISME